MPVNADIVLPRGAKLIEKPSEKIVLPKGATLIDEPVKKNGTIGLIGTPALQPGLEVDAQSGLVSPSGVELSKIQRLQNMSSIDLSEDQKAAITNFVRPQQGIDITVTDPIRKNTLPLEAKVFDLQKRMREGKVDANTYFNEIGTAQNEIERIKKNSFSAETAKDYLSVKINVDPAVLDATNLVSIKSSIDPNNLSESLAYDKYQKDRSISDAFKTSSTFDEGALKYAASQNKQIAAQITKMGGVTDNLPNAFAGALVANALYDPEVIEKIQNDPELAQRWKESESNLYVNYPDYAKTHVAQIISQERENRGLNRGVGNIPRKEATDQLVRQLVEEKILSPRDVPVYESQIRPYLGFWRSVGRGAGRLVAPAFVNENPIKTPDVLSTFGDSYVGTLRGVATSIEDLSDKAVGLSTVGHAKIWNDEKRLKDLLQHDYTMVSVDPKGLWHNVTSSTGNITGFILPMILGGEVGAEAGLSRTASELWTNGLMFEGINSDASAKMFPDNTSKQFLYTTIATAGDMFLAKSLPTKEAIQGAKNILKPEITKVIEDFTEKKITAEVAKKTLFDKARNIVEGNIKTGAVMSGFNIFHNGLDAALGGRDVSLDDAVNEAMNTFKTGFLGSTLLSLPKAFNTNPALSGKIVREVANNEDFFIKVVEDGAKLDPNLEATKNERIRNIKEAANINSEIETTNLTEPQKDKYLLNALQQKIFERKAENATDDVFKKDFEQKAAEAKKIKEAIYKGEDVAPEHQTFEEPVQTKTNELTPQDVHATAKAAGIDFNSAAFKEKSKELTGEEHLDNMTPDQLGKVNDFYKAEKQVEQRTFRTDEEIEKLLNPLDENGEKIKLPTSKMVLPREIKDIVTGEPKMSIKEMKTRAQTLTDLINCL